MSDYGKLTSIILPAIGLMIGSIIAWKSGLLGMAVEGIMKYMFL